jgi:hypothetical protein
VADAAKNNIFFGHHAGVDLKLDGSVHLTPAGVRTHTVINNTFATRRPYLDGNIVLYRNATAGGQSQHTPKNVLIMNNVFWNPNGHTGDGVAINLHLGGWGYAGDSNQYWRGTEIVGNITTGDHIIPSGHAYKFNNSSMTLEGNVTNRTHPGLKGTTLGMVAPKSGQWKPVSDTTRVDAKETDFMPTSTATRLLDAGRASFTDRYGRGLPVVAAPVRDYLNAPRPQGTDPTSVPTSGPCRKSALCAR